MIEIVSSFFATFQDFGRKGFEDIGISESGVLDEYSFRMANILLGDFYNACIEGFINLKFVVHTNLAVSIVGSGEVFVNKQKFFANRVFNLKKGDVVEVRGNLFYICAKNGFKCREYLGSCSASIREGIFAPLSGKIKLKNPAHVKKRFIKPIKPFNRLILRVVRGYEWELIEDFFSKSYKLKSINRQGAVFDNKVKTKRKDIISNGITYGAIQVYDTPIILLKERQTIGGYPKVGTVFLLDLFKLPHLKIQGEVEFVEISQKEAISEYKKYKEYFKRLELLYI